MKRKAGYYWVKYPNRDEWSIEYWNGGMWFTRNPTLLNDNDFTQIDETLIVREQNTPTSEEQLAAPAVSKSEGLQVRELLLDFIKELNKTRVTKYTSAIVDRFLSQQ